MKRKKGSWLIWHKIGRKYGDYRDFLRKEFSYEKGSRQFIVLKNNNKKEVVEVTEDYFTDWVI